MAPLIIVSEVLIGFPRFTRTYEIATGVRSSGAFAEQSSLLAILGSVYTDCRMGLDDQISHRGGWYYRTS
jgi:hypothetical protein